MTVIEVFADIWCPFTHVGLRRLVEQRAAAGRHDVQLRVRAWPLELINLEPMDPDFVAEEVAELRRQVTPGLFVGFDVAAFPATTLPALRLAAAAYGQGLDAGESVSLALREALFEEGRRIDDAVVLADIASSVGVDPLAVDDRLVLDDWDEGVRRGVEGSPHFFVGEQGWFCPALDIRRVDGHLRIVADVDGFRAFSASCFGRTAAEAAVCHDRQQVPGRSSQREPGGRGR